MQLEHLMQFFTTVRESGPYSDQALSPAGEIVAVEQVDNETLGTRNIKRVGEGEERRAFTSGTWMQ
jgi:hypothetical protein